jgi:hypothetical protein
MESKAVGHEIVNEAGAAHVYTAEKGPPCFTPSNKNLVPKRIAFVTALVPGKN